MITTGALIAGLIGVAETVVLFYSVFKTEKVWKERFMILLSLFFLVGLAVSLCLPYARKDLFLSVVVYDGVLIGALAFYWIIYLLISTIEFAAHVTASKKSARDRKELIEKLEKEGRHDLIYNLRTAEWNERYGHKNLGKQ